MAATKELCTAAVPSTVKEANIAIIDKNQSILYYIMEEKYVKNGKEKERKKAYRGCTKPCLGERNLCVDHARQNDNGKKNVLRLDQLIKNGKVTCVNPPKVEKVVVCSKINQNKTIPSVKQPFQVKPSKTSQEKMKKALISSEKVSSDSDSDSSSDSDSDSSSDSDSDSSSDSDNKDNDKVDDKVRMVTKKIVDIKKTLMIPKPPEKKISKPPIPSVLKKNIQKEDKVSSSDDSSDEESDEDNIKIPKVLSMLSGKSFEKIKDDEIKQKMEAFPKTFSDCIRIYVCRTCEVKRSQPLLLHESSGLVLMSPKNDPLEAKEVSAYPLGVLMKVEHTNAPIIYDGSFYAVVKTWRCKDYLLQRCVLTNDLYYPNSDNQWVFVGKYEFPTDNESAAVNWADLDI